MPTPNVIIAGAPKCGTTSIFDWLSDHPEVCASIIKEVCFFMDGDYPVLNRVNYYSHGIEHYQTFFGHCFGRDAKVILEATPHYLYQRIALEMLPLLRPLPKIIFILRRPSERVFSLYQFTQNNLAVFDKKFSFSDFISMIKDGSNGILKDRILLQNAVEHSKYVNYIAKWIDKFGTENIFVFLFEDMIKDPSGFMKHVSHCIGIDGRFWERYTFSTKNETLQVRNQRLHRVKRMMGGFIPGTVKEKVFKKIYNGINIEQKSHKSLADRKTLEILEKEFVPYNEALSYKLKINLSIWK